LTFTVGAVCVFGFSEVVVVDAVGKIALAPIAQAGITTSSVVRVQFVAEIGSR
jgi:hypothetical protein